MQRRRMEVYRKLNTWMASWKFKFPSKVVKSNLRPFCMDLSEWVWIGTGFLFVCFFSGCPGSESIWILLEHSRLKSRSKSIQGFSRDVLHWGATHTDTKEGQKPFNEFILDCSKRHGSVESYCTVKILKISISGSG